MAATWRLYCCTAEIVHHPLSLLPGLVACCLLRWRHGGVSSLRDAQTMFVARRLRLSLNVFQHWAPRAGWRVSREDSTQRADEQGRSCAKCTSSGVCNQAAVLHIAVSLRTRTRLRRVVVSLFVQIHLLYSSRRKAVHGKGCFYCCTAVARVTLRCLTASSPSLKYCFCSAPELKSS